MSTDNAIISWLEKIDDRLQSIERRLVTRNEHQTLQNRVQGVESKTDKLSLKVAGISATLAFLAFVASKLL